MYLPVDKFNKKKYKMYINTTIIDAIKLMACTATV
jgi:hypothetical protein